MKKILILLFGAFYLVVNAQSRIELSENKVTQLIFPEEIKDYKGGFLPSDILIETKGNIIYIQPVGGFIETNLNVTTVSNVYYSFDLSYSAECRVFNHVISRGQAFHDAGVITEPNRTIIKANNDVDHIVDKINQHSGNIHLRNGVRKNKMEILLNGIYVHKNDLFFKIRLTNTSNIAYDIDLLTFIIKGKKTKSVSTQENIQVSPKQVFKDGLSVEPNSSKTVIFQFDKFNIGDHKKLFIELYEKQGERNISLLVDTYFIINADAI
ncbi:MAG: DUF4138 domain-containing protein [Bacteroidales bacterium]